MQLANIMLRLGGDQGNTVPKYNVTPSEIAVLRHIHGDEAVFDVEPTDTVTRPSRVERQRLVEIYGRREGDKYVAPAVDALFPGIASRVFEGLDELDLQEEFYKAESYVRARSTPRAERRAAPAAAAEPNEDAPSDASAEDDETDDGIGDMTDEHAGNLWE